MYGIVEYSSSSESEDETEKKELHSERKRTHSTEILSGSAKVQRTDLKYANEKLPVPGNILSMFNGKKADHEDDPTLHSGRTRSFAHERGNWASFVSIPYCAVIDELIDELTEILQPFAQFTRVDDFHISLSKTVPVRHHCIDPLVKELRTNLKSCYRESISLGTLEFYCNDELTRTFLGLKAVGCDGRMESYVKAVDRAFAEFQLPPYYEEPSFHVSLLWSLGDSRPKIPPSTITDLQGVVNRFYLENSSRFEIDISEVRLKTGNKTFMFQLQDSKLVTSRINN